MSISVRALGSAYDDNASTPSSHSEAGSSNQDTNKKKGDEDSIKMSKYLEGFNSCNSKVKYYCSKTIHLEFCMGEMIDDLVEAQKTATAFLVQEPPTGDHFILSFVFHLIEKTVTLIDWKELNHDCFWKDFKRHTKVLSNLIDNVQMVTHDTTHTAVDKYNRALEIFEQVVSIDEYPRDMRLKASGYQSEIPYGDLLSESIKITSLGHKETIYIEWSNRGHSKPQVITLQQTHQNFRLRFLRCLIYYARRALTLVFYTMARLDTAMLTETHLTKIQLCNEVAGAELTPYEKYSIIKAKREFDAKWKDISETIYKMNLRLGLLEECRQHFKRILKDPSSCPKLSPMMESVTLYITWPTFIGIIGDSILAEMESESFDFSMYTDRTEDIIDLIEGMWKNSDRTAYLTMDALLNMIHISLRAISSKLIRKDVNFFKSIRDQIEVQRSRLKRYLRRALEVFEHKVFKDIPVDQKGFSKTTLRLHGRGTPNSEGGDDSDSDDDSLGDSPETSTKEPQPEPGSPFWIEVNGGFRLAITEQRELLIKNLSNSTRRFDQLSDEQQTFVTSIMTERLVHYLAEEVAKAKVKVEDASETKSMLKYLKQRDRTAVKDKLGIAIGNGVNQMQEMLMLVHVMKMLKSISLKYPD